MAEIAVKIGDNSTYRDGDVLCAFNRRRIRCVHAQHLCHVQHAGFNGSGLRPNDSLSRDYFEAVSQYRFERTSRTTIVRVEIDGGNRQEFGPAEIDVPLFLSRRVQHARHAIFGEPGAEVWYGGVKRFDDARLDAVWQAIEAKTANRESAFELWPAGQRDLRSHLFVRVDDFDEAERLQLESGDEGVRRAQTCDWADVLGLNGRQRNDVRDRSVTVDVRGTIHLRTLVVREKTPLEREAG